MGVCTSKPQKPNQFSVQELEGDHGSCDPSGIPKGSSTPKNEIVSGKQSPFFPFYSPSPVRFFKKSPAPTGGPWSASSTAAARYALADVEKVEEVFSDPQVFDFFSNPTIDIENKRKVVHEIATSSLATN